MSKKMTVCLILCIFFSIILCAISCIRGSTNPIANEVIEEVQEHYPQDNIIEEGAEELIEDYTTLDVDLSPTTVEMPIPADK